MHICIVQLQREYNYDVRVYNLFTLFHENIFYERIWITIGFRKIKFSLFQKYKYGYLPRLWIPCASACAWFGNCGTFGWMELQQFGVDLRMRINGKQRMSSRSQHMHLNHVILDFSVNTEKMQRRDLLSDLSLFYSRPVSLPYAKCNGLCFDLNL